MSNSKEAAGSPARAMIRIPDLIGEDEEDSALLKEMAHEARLYLESFSWCTVILEGYIGAGIGGVFAIFLFHMVPARPEVDDWMWVVIGDIPSAYLPYQDAKSPKEVFHEYVDGMTRWVQFVRSGVSEKPDDVPPLGVPPTAEWADNLDHRIRSLKEILGSSFVE